MVVAGIVKIVYTSSTYLVSFGAVGQDRKLSYVII